MNLANLVVRNENNNALFNKLAFKNMDQNTFFNNLNTLNSNMGYNSGSFYNISEEYDKNKVKMASEMAKDQIGCRLLQKWLELKSPEINKEIFQNVLEHFSILMRDPFGNYLCQKLIEISGSENIKKIIDNIYRDFLDIAINQHGTRALQKLVENLRDEINYKKIIILLKENIFELINDANANHVIQKCLQTLSFEQKNFIYDICTSNIVMISNHKHGKVFIFT